MMKISIAMATYNGADHIEGQLHSFLTQSRQPDELVICDDRSTDDTVNIIQDFAKKAPFPVFYSQNEQNLGYTANFNRVLSKTVGDLVFLSDQDDVWFPGKLKQIEELAAAHPDFMVFINDAALTDENLDETGITNLEQIRSGGYSERDYILGCCSAVRREMLDLCLPIPDGYPSHDSWIMRFANDLNTKLVSREVLQYYRRHNDAQSSFIINSTDKISRKDVIRHKIKSLKMKKNRSAKTLRKLRIYEEGLQRAVQHKNGMYQAELESLLVDVHEKMENEQTRIDIRSKILPMRVFAAAKHLVRGGYRKESGIKSALRDLIRNG